MLLVIAAVGCGGTSKALSPASPSGSAASPLALDLPIRAGDSRNSAYGIWPFGVHGAGHAADGHPGYDFEFAPGAPVLAAASGTVDNVLPDMLSVAGDVGRYSVQLRTPGPGGDYFIAYTNLVDLAPGIVPRAAVTRGQIIGSAGAVADSSRGAFGMTHFQVSDPSDRTPALSNFGAVNPETYFSSAARAQLAEIWRTAIYINEWCEPFLGNSRANLFPMSRAWTLQSGTGPAAIEIRCPVDSVDAFEYTFRSTEGAELESGRMKIGWNVRPIPPVDFISSTGQSRLGLYDIVETTLELSLAKAGEPRPAAFPATGVYSTAK
jgi:hypothetical protein